MNTLTEMQRRAIIDYTTDLTRRTLEMALALVDTPQIVQTATQPAPRKRGRPRKHPLPG